MANGNMLTILREMAEHKRINPETALPFVFQALADIIEGQNDSKTENLEYRKKRESEEDKYKELNEAKHRACDERLQALETKKDLKIAIIGASGVIVGAVLTFLGIFVAS